MIRQTLVYRRAQIRMLGTVGRIMALRGEGRCTVAILLEDDCPRRTRQNPSVVFCSRVGGSVAIHTHCHEQ